jgi:hypothetical protein
MSDVKAQNHKLAKTEDGAFGKTWSYHCDTHPIEYALQPGFFKPMLSNFMAGDTIRIIETRKNVVTATVDCMVLEMTPSDVVFAQAGKIRRFKGQSAAPTIKKNPDEPDVRYIQGVGALEQDKKTGEYIVKEDGKEVARFPKEEKGKANAMIRGDIPVPAAA